jgi:hypothetical protein
MLRFLIGGLLIVHGLVTVAQSLGVFGRGTEPENPTWLNWWPTPIGRSWLLGSLGLEETTVSWLVGALWVVGGITFLAAAFGILTHHEWWRTLTVLGAFASLVVLVPYFHPWYALVTILNIGILIALLWLRWPSENLVGA